MPQQSNIPLPGNQYDPRMFTNMNNTNQFQHVIGANTLGQPEISINQGDTTKLIYNNVGEKTANKEIQEYIIDIDSKDRNTSLYRNPFLYTVALKPISGQDRNPQLDVTFKNIRYVNLDYCLLPRYYKLKITTQTQSGDIFTAVAAKITAATTITDMAAMINTTQTVGTDVITYVYIAYTGTSGSLTTWTIEFIVNGNINQLYSYNYVVATTTTTYIMYAPETDFNFDLYFERYLLLNIEELADLHRHATNQETQNSFETIYPYDANGTYSQASFVTGGPTRYFKNNNEHTLNKLTIDIQNSSGDTLVPSNLNTSITTPNNCICTDDVNGNRIINYQCASHYIRHPGYNKLQNHLTLRIGCEEISISHLPFT